ncbi:unnamed protein product [Mytilus edulis]|uniref:Uncharacterized protein n=1 Tax=Mytilus edulis TaxID=6550 RepID=A0A8S3UQS4_MYTED|nr:unnamed protein product [Mytilus edulis]
MAMSIKREHIKGIQRIGKMWRLYFDAEEDRLTLLSEGVVLKEKTTPSFHKTQNNKYLQHGNFTSDCPNEWMCRGFNKSGHKLIECPTFFESMKQKETKDQQEKENQLTEQVITMQETEQNEHIEDITHQHNQEDEKTDDFTDLSNQSTAILEQNITVTTNDKKNLTPEKKKRKKNNIPEKNESLSHTVVSKNNNTGKQPKEKTSQKQLDINRFTTPNRK